MPFTAMSEAEQQIMHILWKNGGKIDTAGLLGEIQEQHRDWKRTTVRTFLTRLMDKGYVVSRRRGHTADYAATLSEEEYRAAQARGFIDDVFGGSVKDLLASLVEQDSLSAQEMDELDAFWNEKKGKI